MVLLAPLERLVVLEWQDFRELPEHLEQQGQQVTPGQLDQRELLAQVELKVLLETLVPKDLVEPRVVLEQPDYLE